MGGEDGAHGHLPRERPGLVGCDALIEGTTRGAREEASLRATFRTHVARALHLLGHVGEVEVDGEGARDHGRLVQVEAVDDLAGLGGVVSNGGADPLHGVQQGSTPVLGERVAEECAQCADVLAQGRVGRLVCRGHERTVPRPCCASVS